MVEVKADVTALITEVELRWQAKLAEQAEQFEGLGPTGAPPDFTGLRAELAQRQAAVEDKLHAQDTELQ